MYRQALYVKYGISKPLKTKVSNNYFYMVTCVTEEITHLSWPEVLWETLCQHVVQYLAPLLEMAFE